MYRRRWLRRPPSPAAKPPLRRSASAGPPSRRRAAPRYLKPASERLRRRRPHSSGAFLWPVRGRVLAAYGSKTDGTHNDGINIAAPQGAPVQAADAGVVAYTGNELRGYGNLDSGQASERLDLGLRPLRPDPGQARRKGRARAGHRAGRLDRQRRRAAAAFRAAPRQSPGRSARVPGLRCRPPPRQDSRTG